MDLCGRFLSIFHNVIDLSSLQFYMFLFLCYHAQLLSLTFNASLLVQHRLIGNTFPVSVPRTTSHLYSTSWIIQLDHCYSHIHTLPLSSSTIAWDHLMELN